MSNHNQGLTYNQYVYLSGWNPEPKGHCSRHNGTAVRILSACHTLFLALPTYLYINIYVCIYLAPRNYQVVQESHISYRLFPTFVEWQRFLTQNRPPLQVNWEVNRMARRTH